MTPLINGKRHSWASIRINMLGREITGVNSINYEDTVNKENIYGAGKMPVARGEGNYEAVCGMELHQYEVVAIQQAAAGLRLQSIPPFDIVVTYIPVGSEQAVTDIIRNVEFTKNIRDYAQGDTSLPVPVELICSHIKWDGQIEE